MKAIRSALLEWGVPQKSNSFRIFFGPAVNLDKKEEVTQKLKRNIELEEKLDFFSG
ncbi:hypothetical protein GCM10020331_095260 [Ectobacillus funiculus]